MRLTASDYAELLHALQRPRPTTWRPVDRWRQGSAPLGTGVPFSAPTISQLADRLALFDPRVRVRFALEAVAPLLPSTEFFMDPVRMVASILADPVDLDSEMRVHQLRRIPDQDVKTLWWRLSTVYIAVCRLTQAMAQALEPQADERVGHSSDVDHCAHTIMNAAMAEADGMEEPNREPVGFDDFLERWWRRCMAIVPIHDAMIAELEWGPDFPRSFEPTAPADVDLEQRPQ